MIDLQALPELAPYGMAREEKRAFLARELGELTRLHGEHCPEYGRLLAALGACALAGGGLLIASARRNAPKG